MDDVPKEHSLPVGKGSSEKGPDQKATMISTYLTSHSTLLHGFNEEIISLRARLQAQEQRLELQDAKIKLQEQQLATAKATTNSNGEVIHHFFKESLKLYENITMANIKIAALEQSLLTSKRDIKETARRLKHVIEQRHKDKAQTLETVRNEIGNGYQKEALGVRPGPIHQTADYDRELNEALPKFMEHTETNKEHTHVATCED